MAKSIEPRHLQRHGTNLQSWIFTCSTCLLSFCSSCNEERLITCFKLLVFCCFHVISEEDETQDFTVSASFMCFINLEVYATQFIITNFKSTIKEQWPIFLALHYYITFYWCKNDFDSQHQWITFSDFIYILRYQFCSLTGGNKKHSDFLVPHYFKMDSRNIFVYKSMQEGNSGCLT